MNEEITKRLILIGERLKKAREALGYTQEEVAEKLSIGRPRYSDIENGKRDVPLKELYNFCEFFGRPIGYFIKERLTLDNGFKVLFRKTGGDQEVAKVIVEFETLCEKMCTLEEMMDAKIKPPVSEDYAYEKDRLSFWGKHYANHERQRLSLGQVPLRNLDQILEEKCALKIFYLPILEERRIFGMFTYDEQMGACVLINTNASFGKQLFSLAHEYAHFVFHKGRLGIISFEKDKDTADESLADHFAGDFLMPEEAVNDIFNIRIKNRRDLTAEDIVYFAEYFGVSFQAMIYRLNNLRLLSNDAKENFINQTLVNVVRRSMGISEPERGKLKFPTLYVHFCLKAYQQGKITTAKLAEFLELPLYQAMELAKKLKRSDQDDPIDTI